MNESIKVDIWSDVACPWCYIGKRRFEAAAEQFATDGRAVEVEYHSFELSPETPVDFEGSQADFLVAHKGVTPAQAKEMGERVTDIASAVGLSYDFGILKHTNTIKAHQLLHYAKAKGVQERMKERLLKAHFEEGRHVGHDDDLADLGAEIGLDREDILRSLAGGEFRADVQADKDQALRYGISGVPFFVIDSKYGVSGAQETATFVAALTQAWDERDAA